MPERHVLTLKQSFTLIEWVKDYSTHKPEAFQSSTYEELAAEATEALGFQVKFSNLRTVCREFNLKVRRKGRPVKASGLTAEAHASIMEKIDGILKTLQAQEEALTALEEKVKIIQAAAGAYATAERKAAGLERANNLHHRRNS